MRSIRSSATLSALLCVVLSGCARHPATAVRPKYPEVSVIPIPVSVTRLGGPNFRITPASAIVADTTSADERRAAVAFAAIARPSTGYALPIVANLDSINAAVRAPTDTNRRSIVRFRLSPGSEGGAEGYTLQSDLDSVVIVAPTGAGLFHGMQTFRQLLPFGIDGHQSAIQLGPWVAPAVRITDAPGYTWRGSML